jgi:hypothetical protein
VQAIVLQAQKKQAAQMAEQPILFRTDANSKRFAAEGIK